MSACAQSPVQVTDTVRTKVAVVSLLFNWPSTGGGTIHTFETCKFLQQAGYDVRHIYVHCPEWGLGQVTEPLAVNSEALVFEPANWNAELLQQRVRAAVDAFAPDYVIITDSWNFKPLLAEAVQGYRYFLRLAAQEGLCPLNNVRLLVADDGQIGACPRHQLATPQLCQQCVRDNERLSGSLHQAERELSGYGTPEYDQRLRTAFANAEAVLVVNPLIAAMVSPYARKVCVVPSGFDPERFPATEVTAPAAVPPRRTRLLFAGLIQEYMKGFHVLREACQLLWSKRQDFELVATGDPFEGAEEFITCIGWQSQQDLPRVIQSCDILVFPTIAEEALGRSAVEAMGVGRPVIASRIGGLPFTVIDGATGLLFEPGDPLDLARQIEVLLDDPELRQRLGQAGRKRFEEHFTWNRILARHYLPLLGPPVRSIEIQQPARAQPVRPRVAIIFDNQSRPETTGFYCRRALGQIADVEHFLPAEIPSIPRQGFDLYLVIDDGLRTAWPADLHPCAWWAIDTHLDPAWYRQRTRDFDFVFTAQRDGAENLRAAGIASATWLPLACDPEFHRKHDVEQEFDVSFVGNPIPGPRTQLLELIRQRYPQTFIGNRYFDDMARTYSATRIVFNRSVLNDVNMRVFEALACGSLLVTNDLSENGQSELFQSDQHLVTYRTAQELLQKIDWYLSHPEERERIAEAGRQEVLNRHTYRHRIQQILDTVFNNTASNLPPRTDLATPTAVNRYYEFARPEVAALVPVTARRILELGCGAGRLGASLKQRQSAHVTGIELESEPANLAAPGSTT